jgi:hypothetical protein
VSKSVKLQRIETQYLDSRKLLIHSELKGEGSVSHQFSPSDDDGMSQKIDPLEKELNISEIEARVQRAQGLVDQASQS